MEQHEVLECSSFHDLFFFLPLFCCQCWAPLTSFSYVPAISKFEQQGETFFFNITWCQNWIFPNKITGCEICCFFLTITYKCSSPHKDLHLYFEANNHSKDAMGKHHTTNCYPFHEFPWQKNKMPCSLICFQKYLMKKSLF